MAQSVAAVKAQLGSTEYWIVSMKAGELIKLVQIPKEMEGWDDMSIDERYQRDIKYSRVRSQIAPYLAMDDDRFFGAIIVTVMNHKGMNFEPLDELAKKLPALYATVAENMGVLTFSGGEIFVPLDGQHRIKAIEFAITGRDEKSEAIDGITPCSALANEDVTVILTEYDPDKARKIFTKVNRYARPTTAGQNIITDDDDIIAVLARMVTNDKINARLVNYETNTISKKTDGRFTTLSTIYNCNARILEVFFGEKVDKAKLPSKEKQRLYQDKVFEVWDKILTGIDLIRDAVEDPSQEGDDRRKEIRQHYLLGRPVAQECLVSAFMMMTKRNEALYDDTCEKLNAIPWAMTEDNVQNIWQRVLWIGSAEDGKMVTKNRDIATRLIVYMAGGAVDEQKLFADYVKLFTESERKDKKLPPKVV